MIPLPRPLDLLPVLLQGAGMSLVITALAAGVGLCIALAAGLARISRFSIVRIATTAYVEIFRGTSALVQLFYVFYVLPLIGISLPALAAGVLALGLNAGAYGSEIVRGAILNLDPGQREAAIALNMPAWLYIRRIMIPQAFVAMLPPFGNLLIELLKGTSLVSLITIRELAFTGKLLLTAQWRPTEIYPLMLLIYFVMAVVIARLVRLTERRLSTGLQRGIAQ